MRACSGSCHICTVALIHLGACNTWHKPGLPSLGKGIIQLHFRSIAQLPDRLTHTTYIHVVTSARVPEVAMIMTRVLLPCEPSASCRQRSQALSLLSAHTDGVIRRIEIVASGYNEAACMSPPAAALGPSTEPLKMLYTK